MRVQVWLYATGGSKTSTGITGKTGKTKGRHKNNIPRRPTFSYTPVVIVSLVPIPYRIAALTQEEHALFNYPIDHLAGVIRDIGFRCTTCAKCCTRAFNGHVFLLDRDVAAVLAIDPDALERPRIPNSATRTARSMSPAMH